MKRMSGPCCRSLLALVVLSLLAGAIYSNTLSVPFIFDDIRNVSENPSVQWDSLSWDNIRETVFNPPANVSKRRPVAYVSFGLNHCFSADESVAGYHLTNIAIHVANGLLVYLLIYLILARLVGSGEPPDEGGLCGPFIPSLVAACIFVAHPIQTQAVTYIVQRMTSLAVLFYLAALLFYLYGCLSENRSRRWASWGACFLCWVLSLGTKEFAITLPGAIFLIEWFFFRGQDARWRKRALVCVGIGLFVLVAGIGYSLSVKPFRGFESRDFTMAERLLTQPRVVLLYISLIFWPLASRLNLLHDVPVSTSLFDPPTAVLSLVAIVALMALAVWLARRAPLISFGILWFFLHLVIESSFLPLEMVYEHRLYLPMFGVAFIVADVVQRCVARRQFWVVLPIVLVVGGLSVATYTRNQDWQDRTTLWTDVIEKSPQLARGFTNRAVVYQRQGKHDDAIADYTAAIERDADKKELYRDRGIVFHTKKNYQRALADYNKAIELDPDFAHVYNNRGKLKETLRQFDAALADYSKGIELSPDATIMYLNRANVARILRRKQLVIDDYTRAIELGANSHKVLVERGKMYMAIGNWKAAISDFKKGLSKDANNVGALNNLAWILATCSDAELRNGSEAVGYARRVALKLGDQNVNALDTLAAAFAETGQFDAAVKVQSRAVSIAPRADLKMRLQLYKNGKPFRMGRPN